MAANWQLVFCACCLRVVGLRDSEAPDTDMYCTTCAEKLLALHGTLAPTRTDLPAMFTLLRRDGWAEFAKLRRARNIWSDIMAWVREHYSPSTEITTINYFSLTPAELLAKIPQNKHAARLAERMRQEDE